MSIGKEQEILACATRLFQQKGFHATSMQDLADAVGLQKGSLYHYIGGKEDLLLKIFDLAMSSLSQRLERIVAGSGPAREKLRRAIAGHIQVLADNLGMLTIFVREAHALSPDHVERVRAGRRTYNALFERVLREGVESGEFRPLDVKLVALAILGLCNSMYQWYSPDGRLSSAEIAARFAELVLEGIVASGESGAANESPGGAG